MSAAAKLIRNHVADGLAAAPGVEASVFAARHRNLQDEELPAVLVFTDAERVVESRGIGQGARKYERRIDLHITIVANTGRRNDAGAGVADDIDDLAEAIEAWMFERELNAPVWVEALLVRTEGGVAAQESAQPTPGKVLVFEVLFFDYAPKPNVGPLEDLEEIRARYDLAPTDGQVDAEDSVPVSQT